MLLTRRQNMASKRFQAISNVCTSVVATLKTAQFSCRWIQMTLVVSQLFVANNRSELCSSCCGAAGCTVASLQEASGFEPACWPGPFSVEFACCSQFVGDSKLPESVNGCFSFTQALNSKLFPKHSRKPRLGRLKSVSVSPCENSAGKCISSGTLAFAYPRREHGRKLQFHNSRSDFTFPPACNHHFNWS